MTGDVVAGDGVLPQQREVTLATDSTSPGEASPLQHALPFAAPEIRVAIVRSARRRTLAIHVDDRGEVVVRAPVAAGREGIARFVQRHREWIRRKVDEALRAPAWTPHWGAGGEWHWQGGLLRLASGEGRRACLAGDTLRLPLAAEAPADVWRRSLLAWHRREAVALLAERVTTLFGEHAGQHRLKAVEFRWMRVTWGTCGGRRAADGRRDVVIRLNPWLAALPPELSDSVLLHELAHVEHMHHGAAFYRRLEQLDPRWRQHDEDIKPWARRLFPIAVT